jgi:LPS sulfotransferase NodH
VNWKRALNDALIRTTGLQVSQARRVTAAPGPRSMSLRAGDRLVAAPTFILCTLRSGSTLLRVLLDSHSQIHSPHELHLRYVSVNLDAKWSERSMREMGFDAQRLEYLLWDRILHRELAASGKSHIVCKTPNDVFIADRIRECWPDARFIFLLRHPAAIVRSRQAVRAEDADNEQNIALIRRYCTALEKARQTYDGITVRYEDLTADPRRVTQEICEFLRVPWEEQMLDYGRFDHGRFKVGLGDWADKIKTGKVQAAEPPPPADEIPAPLRRIAAAWGYLPQEPAAAAPLEPQHSS